MENNEQPKTSAATKAVIILASFIAAVSLYIILMVDLPNKPIAGRGGIHDDVPIGGKFTLTDHNGNKFSSQQMNGHLSLVYFGFTYCPDICPTSLNKLSEVITTLDKYQIDIIPIFISVDTERDTPAILKEYLSHFHPKLIGLTGTAEEVKYVAEIYKVFYAKVTPSEGNSSNYMIDHSSFVYLMDKNGKYLKHFYMSDSAEEIVNYIRLNK